jgi:hypothetical protein
VDHPLNESTWRRGWNDAKRIWTGWWFWVIDTVLAGVIGNFFAWYWGVVFVLFGMFCAWLGATAAAPIKQRNEARGKVVGLEKEKEACIEVDPFPCTMGLYERGDKTARAALKVKNISSGVDLDRVSVQILELMEITEEVDRQGTGESIYHMFESPSGWVPANVYWDESNAAPNQFEIHIPRGATRVALVAFHPKGGPAMGFLNTPTRPPMQGCRIVIAISSPSMNTWQGVYYIGYVPPRRDEFDFVEWNSWCMRRRVVDHSNRNREGSQN